MQMNINYGLKTNESYDKLIQRDNDDSESGG